MILGDQLRCQHLRCLKFKIIDGKATCKGQPLGIQFSCPNFDIADAREEEFGFA